VTSGHRTRCYTPHVSRPKGSTKHYEPEAVAYAINAVKAGRSYREVAEELAELRVQVSHMTVKRWVERADAPAVVPPAPAPEAARLPPAPAVNPELAARLKAQRERAAEAPPPPPPAEDDAPFDFEASVQQMIREARAEAQQHAQASNPRGQQAALRRAAELMKLLGQSEKRKPADPDLLVFSKTEIEQAFGEMTELLSNLCARPVMCSECSRALSIKFGRGQ
jgi:hypothetical protein